jgi:hypothetical protein
MNDDNIRAEIARLKEAFENATDTTIQRACQHRIAELERELEKKKEK